MLKFKPVSSFQHVSNILVRPIMYSIGEPAVISKTTKEMKRLKGVKRSVVNKKIRFEVKD